jgi:hypothetical protein
MQHIPPSLTPAGSQAPTFRRAWLGLAAASVVVFSTHAAEQQPPLPLQGHRIEVASDAAREVINWVVDSADHQGLPFLVIDKKDARVFVFDTRARLIGAAPALIGLAVGDDSVAGIGDRPLSSIRPEERTTPAGRFFAAIGSSLQGDEVLWVDYDGGVALHRLATLRSKERRSERLATQTPADNRITYGCINVSVSFYETVVSPAFRQSGGIVYVLPEIRSLKVVFPAFHPGDNLTSIPK